MFYIKKNINALVQVLLGCNYAAIITETNQNRKEKKTVEIDL